jgi:hypothetical protein
MEMAHERLRFTVRHATSRDLQRVLAFYEKHKNPGNSPRSKDVLHGALNNDRKLLVAEVGSGATAEIIAASAVFSHLDGRFREVGATRVVANGFGLQILLYSVSVVHEVLLDPQFEEIYCTVIRENAVSIHNIEKSGFVPWLNPDADLRQEKARIAKLTDRPADVAFFRLPPEAYSPLAANLLRYESEACLRCRSHDQTVGAHTLREGCDVGLALRIESLLYYREAVIELAHGAGRP